MNRIVPAALALLALAAPARTADPKEPARKDAGPLELRLTAKKDTVSIDLGGKTPKEYYKALADLAEQINKGGFGARPPRAPEVDLTLSVVNRSKEEMTIHVGGDPNVYVFEVKGPGVVTMRNPIAFTADFRLPRAVTLAPGKSFDIPVRQLMDGMRGASRLLFFTEPGEYTLTAAYQLSDARGGKGQLLKSEPLKLKVVEKK